MCVPVGTANFSNLAIRLGRGMFITCSALIYTPYILITMRSEIIALQRLTSSKGL